MSWSEYLSNHARRTAGRRKQTYGIDPPAAVADLLARKPIPFHLRESSRLILYILFKSPQPRLKLFWQYLSDKDTPVRTKQIDRLAQDLQPRLSEGCTVATTYFKRKIASRDLARIPPLLEKMLFRTTPYLVVQPKKEHDIAETLKFCSSRGLAVFPRGSSSSAFGGAVPTRNGVVLDLSPMMAILEVQPGKRAVRVQPGARWADVAAGLDPHGLVPVTTPTSRFSTVAGWISTGGMGLNSYAYGGIDESILSVRVVLPDGSLEKLDSSNESMSDLFGTEGQFGILTEITMRVRPKPEYSGAILLTFAAPDQAFAFIQQLDDRNDCPSHVVFFDREYMKKENILFGERTGMPEPLVPELDSVLLHFETQESERRFLSSLNGNSDRVLENRLAARYLWADRYFPLKAQRISPGLLGSEAVIPADRVSAYTAKVRKLARYFHVKPAIETIVCRKGRDYSYLVIVSFSCDYSKSIHYILSLLVIQLLVRTAVRCGGHPYGIGIWNAPYIASRYERGRLARLRKKKKEIDPCEALNPNKFFKIKGRFFSLPALLMSPDCFRILMALFRLAAPALGFFARIIGPKPKESWDVPPSEDEEGKTLLHECALRCTSCGSCVSVCPAYHITEDELVTGRTKLLMGEAILNGEDLQSAEAQSPFQCLHCGLCEEVCQTHLPLRDCYQILENWIEKRFGFPADIVNRFVQKLDDNRDFIKDIFGLDLPDWSPDSRLTRVPAVERPSERKET
jgi:FAD/FMN-containing dehydrogenase/ferredoxin